MRKCDRTLDLLRQMGPMTGAEVRFIGRRCGDESGYGLSLYTLHKMGLAEFGRQTTVCAINNMEMRAWSVVRCR